MQSASQSSPTVACIESLESRQLLSAGTVFAAPQMVIGGPAPLIVPARVRTPSVVGLFSGTATSSKNGKISTITVKFTAQTRRNGLYGTLVVRGHHGGYHYYTLVGSISGTSFSLKFTSTTNGSGTITGTASADGKTLSGKYSVTGGSDGGSFSAKR